METKQTAVEWLVKQIKSDQNQKALSASEWMQVIEQAKEMEQEQIIVAYNEGYDIRDDYWFGSLSTNPTGEQYYNETYGKETDNTGMDIR